MCNICNAKKVAVIGSLSALAFSLAQTAQILDNINAHDQKNLALKRLSDVLDFDGPGLEVDGEGNLQVDESVLNAKADFLTETLNKLFGEQPDPATNTAAPAPEAATEPAKPDGPRSFSEFLDEFLSSLEQIKPEQKAKASGMPDAATAKMVGDLIAKLGDNPNVSVEHHMVVPRGMPKEEIDKNVEELAKLLGVAVDQIKVV